MKYFVFTLLGVLVGLGLFSFGFYTDRSNDLRALKNSSKPNVAELQKNIVLDDPVEITQPGSPAATALAAQALAAPTQPASAEPASATATSVTGVPVPSTTFQNTNPAAVGTTTPSETTATVGSEILPPQEPPVIYDGWANAGFLPEDEQGADIQINNLPETTEEEIR